MEPGPTAVASAEIPGQTIPLQTGGSVFVPEGALAEGVLVQAQRTEMPLLPDDVEPLGQAVEITADAQPAEPVLLRLPIPEGADNPADLVIVRVEPDGATTFLMTEVDGEHLMAYTPGFSVYLVGQFLSAKPVFVAGNNDLLMGQPATYYIYPMAPRSAQSATWRVAGDATILSQSDNTLTLQAASHAGRASIEYHAIDLDRGVHWYGKKDLLIRGNAILLGGPYVVSLVTENPVLYADEQAHIRADVHGAFQPPITWTWDYGDGTVGSATGQGDATLLDLPPKLYAPQDHPYSVAVTAKDSQGVEATGHLLIRALEQPLAVRLEGAQDVAWVAPGVLAGYEAAASGGTPAYHYDWTFWPGGEARQDAQFASEALSALSREMYAFAEPGEYLIVVVAGDSQANTARAALPVRVTGGEPLGAHILDLPETARADADVAFSVQVRGGIMVMAGKKAGYTLSVDWGEGGPPTVEAGVGAANTPDQGTVVRLSHGWAEPGTYSVSIVAHDATGASARATRQIRITEEDAAPEPVEEPTESGAAEPEAEPTGVLVWVRQEPAVVNVNNDPLEAPAPEPRFAGSYLRFSVAETSISSQEAYVDHGETWYEVTIACQFERPPLVLTPDTRYRVTATCTHEGTPNRGAEGLGVQFWYSAQRGYQNVVEPPEVLAYYPWNPQFTGLASKEWMIAAPPARNLGDTFDLYGSWWNCAPCNVTWTYRAEYH